MNIHELSSYNLADAIKFHTELNPRLWDDREHLHPQIRAKLLDIARDFQEFLGVSNLALEDITISGSNAAYTYTPHSDIDLHLVVKMPQDNNEVYQELFNAKKYQYNDMHNITVGGADVELYVQPADQSPVSLGEYSVLHNQWLQVPKKKKADINQSLVRNKYQTLAAQIEAALSQSDSTKITALTDKIKKMRQTGLAKNGEFGPENLAFKMLRTQGLIDRLHKAKNAARDAELSIEETQKQFRYGFAQSKLSEVDSTPDGVSPNTQMFFDDESGKSELESTLHKFADQIVDELGIKNIPEIIFHHGTDWTKSTGSFGQYSPDNNTLQLAVSGRHILDIVRTMAHELTHCKQGEIGDFPTWAGETGSPWEDQANAMAGRILRGFASEKPELFADVKLEEASGYIPTRAQAKDKRFSTALTVDIKPGQTGQEANKLNLQTDAQGKPALLMKSKNLRESKEKINLDSKLLHLLELIKKHQHEDPHKFGKVAAVLIDGAEKESSGVSSRTKEGKMHHAERNAIASHLKRFGSIGPNAVMVTTLSPCCHNLKDRAGASCTDLLKKYGIKRVWAGYQDPAQHPHDEYPFMMEVTNNPDIFRACKDRYQEFAGGHLAAQLAESLRQEFALLEDEFLGEIKMTGKNLRAEAAKTGAQAGMEFEMIVPNVESDVEPEMEPDMDQDQRARSFSDVRDFFHDGDYNGRRAVDDLIEELSGEYEEWKQEQTAEQWDRDGVDYMRDFVEVNDLFDREEAIDTARDEVIDANPGLPPESKDFQDLLRARLDELQEQFVLEAFEDRGRIHDDAFETFAQEQNEEYDERSFLDDKYQTMSDIQSNFDIAWPYYYDINDGQSGDMDGQQVADEFSSYMGKPVNYSDRYHGGRREPGTYVVEPDGSLEGDNPGDGGLEFVSPPMPIDEMISDLNKVKEWAGRTGCYTNDSTGLHINISVPNYSIDKLDYVKLAILMGDEYILDLFGRSGNTYAKSAMGKIKSALKQKPEAAAQIMDLMKQGLDGAATKAIHTGITDKYTSINTKTGYIEFRSPGGDWLDSNFDKIENTLLRFTVALSAAINPEAYRKEYLTKLYKLLSEGMDKSDTDVIQLFSNYSAGELDKPALIRQVRAKQLARNVAKGKATGKMWWDVSRPGYMSSIEVVANSKEEAIDVALQPGNYPDWASARNTLQAKPLRPYQEEPKGPTLNGRPSNPDGNYVIVGSPDEQTPVYRYMASGGNDALLVLRQWISANPGTRWNFKFDPRGIMGQPRAQSQRPAQQEQGNWGIWIVSSNRFARQPNTIVADNVLRRFPSQAAAMAFLERTREENPQMRTDVEVREIPADYTPVGTPVAPAQPVNRNTLAPTGPGPWEVFRISDGSSVAELGQTNRMSAEVEARRVIDQRGEAPELYGVRTRQSDSAQAGQFQEPDVRRGDLTPRGPGPWEIYRLSDNSSVRVLSHTDRPSAEVEARMALGMRGEAPELYAVRTRQVSGSAPRSSYELFLKSNGRVVTAPSGNPIVFQATDPDDAANKIARYVADFNLPGDPTNYDVRSVLQPAQQDAAQGGIVDVASGTEWDVVNLTTGQTIGRVTAADQRSAERAMGPVITQFNATTGNDEDDDYGVRPVTQPAPRTLTTPGQAQQEWTGAWLVLDPEGRVLQRFTGIGNVQADANRHAMNWLRSNPRHMQAGVTVAPEMA